MGLTSKIYLLLLAFSSLIVRTKAQITEGSSIFTGGDLGAVLVSIIDVVTLVEINTAGQAALFLAVVGVFYYASINIFEQVFLRLEEIILDAFDSSTTSITGSNEYPTGVKGMAFAVAFLSANGITGLIGLAIANIMGLLAITIILLVMLKLLGVIGDIRTPNIGNNNQTYRRSRRTNTDTTTSNNNNRNNSPNSGQGLFSSIGSWLSGDSGSTPSAGLGASGSATGSPGDHAGKGSSSSGSSSSSSGGSGSTPSAGLGANRSNKFSPGDHAGKGSSSSRSSRSGGNSSDKPSAGLGSRDSRSFSPGDYAGQGEKSSESIFSRAGSSIKSIINTMKDSGSAPRSDWWNSSDKKSPGIGSNMSNKFSPGDISDDLEDAETELQQAYKNAENLKEAVSDMEMAIQLIGDSEKKLDELLRLELDQLDDATTRLKELYDLNTGELKIEKNLQEMFEKIGHQIENVDFGSQEGPSVRQVFENIQELNNAVLEGINDLYDDLNVEKGDLESTLEEINQIVEELKFSVTTTNKIEDILEEEEQGMRDIYSRAKKENHLSKEFKKEFGDDKKAIKELESRYESLKSKQETIIDKLDSLEELIAQEENQPWHEFLELKTIYNGTIGIDNYIYKCKKRLNEDAEGRIIFVEDFTDEELRDLYESLEEEERKIEQKIIPNLERLGIIERDELFWEEKLKAKISELLDELK